MAGQNAHHITANTKEYRMSEAHQPPDSQRNIQAHRRQRKNHCAGGQCDRKRRIC